MTAALALGLSIALLVSCAATTGMTPSPTSTAGTPGQQTATTAAGTPSPQAGATVTGTTTSGNLPGAVVETVQVNEGSYYIRLDKDVSPPGAIQFDLHNDGPLEHTLVIIKTDLAPDNLPMSGNQVDMSALDVVYTQPTFPPNTTQTVVVNMDPGSYVLICNLPGHYQQGMYTGFTVQSGS